MFKWLRGNQTGLEKIFADFGQMLEDGRHVFDAAANAIVGGTNPDTVKDDLYATDRRINRVEQEIRRAIVVHLTVADRADVPVCLALMSLVKDAERIGDYAKNMLEVAFYRPDFNHDGAVQHLVELKDRASRALAKMRNLVESQDETQARAFIADVDAMLSDCDDHVDRLLSSPDQGTHAVAEALTYRYIKRVLAHALNIVSAIVMPLDKLDYFDERPEDRE